MENFPSEFGGEFGKSKILWHTSAGSKMLSRCRTALPITFGSFLDRPDPETHTVASHAAPQGPPKESEVVTHHHRSSETEPTSRLPRMWLWVAISAVALNVVSAGCAAPVAAVKPTQALNVAVRVEADANQGFPIAVSMVLVYGQMALTKIKAMPAKQWFDERKQLARDFPECSGFVAYNWEWVPGRYVSPITIVVPPDVLEVFAFSNYLAKGDHRVSVNVPKGLNLTLGKEEAISKPLVDHLLKQHTTDKDRRVYHRRCDEPEQSDPTRPAGRVTEGVDAAPAP